MIEAKTKIERYESYRDSGIEWLGEIPEHWKIESFKHILTERNEKNAPIRTKEILSLSIDKGVTLYAEKTTNLDRFKDDFSKYKLAQKGDLVFNSMNMIVGAVGVSDYFGCVSPVYYTYYGELNNSDTSKFYEYLFRSKIVQGVLYSLGKGLMAIDRGDGKYNTLRLKVSRDDLRSMKLPFPNSSEQTQIVQFLNDKTTKIEDAIAIKQQQISLLKERKQILIHKAVTRGLDDSVTLKDSGVEWIGEIPEHWEVKPLKYIGNSIIGLTYSPNDLCDKEEGTLVFRSSNLFEGKIKYGEKENVYVKSRISDKLMVRENDILICSRNGSRDLIGKCALISKEDIGASFGAFTTVFRSDINPYIFCILNSSIFKALSGSFLTSTINQLTIGNLNSIYVPVPPKEERDELKSYINNFSDKIETAISLKQQEISKLQEYKSSLINGVVTGKIRVC